MKSKLLTLLAISAISALTVAARAESSITLTGVHNCCKKCDNGIIDAVTKAGGTAKTDKSTVTITAKDEATAEKAAASLLAAGYAGKESKVPAVTDAKVKSATVSGVHLCCGKCVTGVTDALSKVKGVKGNTAAKGADSFEVTGDFKPKAVFAALNKAGYSGKASK